MPAGRRLKSRRPAKKEERKLTPRRKRTARELKAKDKKEKKMADENNEKYETKRRMRKGRQG